LFVEAQALSSCKLHCCLAIKMLHGINLTLHCFYDANNKIGSHLKNRCF
jgi:hypothetical protein